MSIWKEIKTALKRIGRRSNPLKRNQRKQSAASITKIYIGGNVTGGNIIAGNENKANINSTKAKKKRK